MSKLTRNTLILAKFYMQNRRRGTWQAYEKFKKMVGWLDDPNEYCAFIRDLTKILKL